MPDGTAYEYTYGDNNELREIRLPGTDAISYPSYTWTRPDAVQYPGGGRREYEYDPLMRITRILAKDPGKNILLDYSYSYDSMDNILSKQTGQGTYNYTYDALYRLTDVQVDIPGQESEGFSYDAVGNRLSEEGVEGEWTYNPNNELLTFARTEYTYDANGNATQLLLDGAVMFTYHYNTQDRLVQMDDVNGSTIAEYSYDPFGRRLWKDVGSTRTYFFYADEGLVAEYDTSGTEIRTYGYRPDSTWTTDPLWLKQNGEYYFYQNDHLGTPQKLVQQNGAIAWSASYAAFGKATIEVETVTNNLRFPGQYVDAETGLHYNWHRYYHSGIGRYLRIDPIGLEGGVNIFLYAQDNPFVYIDELGLAARGEGWGGTVGVGVASFSGAGLNVEDDNGLRGELRCFGAGAGIGGGFLMGVQYNIWKDVDSICELHGWKLELNIGGIVTPKWPFVSVGIAGQTSLIPFRSFSKVIIGIGVGGFGGFLDLIGRCQLKDYKKICKEWEECRQKQEQEKQARKAKEIQERQAQKAEEMLENYQKGRRGPGLYF